jgi:integrase
MARARRGFGEIRQLPSGRWQVQYQAPDGRRRTARTPDDRALTFAGKGAAERWLVDVGRAMESGTWTPPDAARAPKVAPVTFAEYAEVWVRERRIAVTTREDYESLLRLHLLPTFGHLAVGELTSAAVRAWHSGPMSQVGPTSRARSYGLLRSILGTAVDDGILVANPCKIRGAGSAPTVKAITPVTPAELAALVAELPERYRALPLVLAYGSLRFGEAAGLKVADVDLVHGVLHVRRGVVRTKDHGLFEKEPKSRAGKRAVAIPMSLVPVLAAHLEQHAGEYVFPARSGGPLAASTFQRVFDRAAARIGRPDVTPHVLRHSGQSWSAEAGASLPELMARAGQVSPAAALRYLHAASERQRQIADRLPPLP